jgi:RNA polymerase sigma-70 factor, ECF subfamily
MNEAAGAHAPTLAEPADDKALVARVLAGDGAAFELVMRRHNRRLYRIARSVLRDDAEAEDVLQEAYLSAFRAMSAWRGESSLATWLSRLVLNEALGRRRRQKRRDNIVPITALDGFEEEHEAMDDVDTETPDRALGRSQLRGLLERRLDALPEAFRTVFMLRGVEELSVEETAQCLGIPEATVRSRHFRARSLLRESLAQDVDLAERELFGFDGARCDRIVARVLREVGA